MMYKISRDLCMLLAYMLNIAASDSDLERGDSTVITNSQNFNSKNKITVKADVHNEKNGNFTIPSSEKTVKKSNSKQKTEINIESIESSNDIEAMLKKGESTKDYTKVGVLGFFGCILGFFALIKAKTMGLFKKGRPVSRSNENITRIKKSTGGVENQRMSLRTVFSAFVPTILDTIGGMGFLLAVAIKDICSSVVGVEPDVFNNQAFWICIAGTLLPIMLFRYYNARFRAAFIITAVFYFVSFLTLLLALNFSLAASLFGIKLSGILIYVSRFLVGCGAGTSFIFLSRYITAITPEKWLPMMMNAATVGFPIGTIIFFLKISLFKSNFNIIGSVILGVICFVFIILFFIKNPSLKESKTVPLSTFLNTENRWNFLLIHTGFFISGMNGINYVFLNPEACFGVNFPVDVSLAILVSIGTTLISSIVINRWGFKIPILVSTAAVVLSNIAFYFDYQRLIFSYLMVIGFNSGLLICPIILTNIIFSGPLLRGAMFWGTVMFRVSNILSIFVIPQTPSKDLIFILYMAIVAAGGVLTTILEKKWRDGKEEVKKGELESLTRDEEEERSRFNEFNMVHLDLKDDPQGVNLSEYDTERATV